MNLGANPLTIVGAVILVIGIALASIPIDLGSHRQGVLEAKVYSVEYVMTAAYKVYGNERLGKWVAKTVVKNTGDGPLYDVTISYKVEGFTEWSEPRTYKAIPPGGAIVDLYYPKFSSDVVRLQTATPTTLYVKIKYKAYPQGEELEEVKQKPINMLGFNDWVFSGLPPEENTGSFQDNYSNYELIAAWVTYKDPIVERYAAMANKLAGGAGAALSDEEAIKFLEAAWRFSVENGITYQTEPQTFWTSKSAQYVKYPRDVIRDKSATCLDSTIFLAALAMSQGLNAYIVFKPGHALPIIELPSGQWIPIESTLLNEKVSFEEAVKKGMEVAKEALSGPHLIADIANLQASGVIPPELPELPPDTLEKWGYTMETSPARSPEAGAPGPAAPAAPPTQPEPGGGQGGAPIQPQPEPEPDAMTFVSTNPPPTWSITVPGDWVIDRYIEYPPYEVDLFAPDYTVGIIVMWMEGSPGEMRQVIEDILAATFGEVTIAGENSQGSLAGYPATTVAYQTGYGDLIVVRYASIGGYVFAVSYLVSANLVNDEVLQALEGMISTFTIQG